jgi:hypothetical protein
VTDEKLIDSLNARLFRKTVNEWRWLVVSTTMPRGRYRVVSAKSRKPHFGIVACCRMKHTADFVAEAIQGKAIYEI